MITPRQEARLVTTNSDRLRELARSDIKYIRQEVARNPNTPIDVLYSLGTEFPDALLSNPVWDLLLLENPNLFGDMPRDTLHSLLSCASESFIELVLKYYRSNILNEVEKEIYIPATILNKLAYDEDISIRKAVAKHSNTRPFTLGKLAYDNDISVRQAVAQNRNTPAIALGNNR